MERKTQLNFMIKIALLGALGGALMLIKAPLAIFPSFLTIDLSDIPAIIGALVLGPLAGVLVEVMKILINFILNGSFTGGVGELANVLIGISLVLPIGLIYKKHSHVKGAIIGGIVGTISMTVMGALLNYFVLLPLYANLMGMEVMDFVYQAEQIKIFGGLMNTEWDLVLYGITPFNIFKGVLLTTVTALIYRFVIPPLMRIQN